MVTRELALMQAELGLVILGLTHVPGVANDRADALSRLSAPEPRAVPAVPEPLPRDRPPRRDAAFWRSRVPARPSVADVHAGAGR